jgi:hypothetical protein
MCAAGHFQPLSRLFDWALESQRHKTYAGNEHVRSDIAKLLNSLGLYAPWSSVQPGDNLSNSSSRATSFLSVLDVFKKHEETFEAMYESYREYDGDLYCGWASPEVIKGLVNSGNRKNGESIFHEYCMTEVDDDLINFMVDAGIQPDPLIIDHYLNVCYDACAGSYPKAAIAMHLASGGRIEVTIDYDMVGGPVMAKFISRQCQLYGAAYPELCSNVIDKFLGAHSTKGLFTHGMPREILHIKPELAADFLASDLGL